MRQDWSLIKDGQIVETITNGISGGKRNLVGGRSSANHTETHLLANNYLPHVSPMVKRFEQLGAQYVQEDSVTNLVEPKPRVNIIDAITSNVNGLYNIKKQLITPDHKRERAQVRGIYLNQKAIISLAGKGPDLAPEEKQELLYLNALAERVFNLAEGEVNIIIEAEDKTDEELQALPDDWETGHPDWTE